MTVLDLFRHFFRLLASAKLFFFECVNIVLTALLKGLLLFKFRDCFLI